jgi:hypothetical protein
MGERDWRVVTRGEARELLPVIQPFFGALVGRYNEERYCPHEYQELRRIFGTPIAVRAGDISRALRWKYARNKLLSTHRVAAKRFVKRWKLVCEARTLEKRVDALSEPDARSHDFVSRVFLVHLTAPDKVPMIDRFNHRAVRWLLGTVRPAFVLGGEPLVYDDVVLLGNFIDGIRSAWIGVPPKRQVMDRYLMMLGRQVAPR